MPRLAAMAIGNISARVGLYRPAWSNFGVKITHIGSVLLAQVGWVLVKVETDEGITGIGEAYHGAGVHQIAVDPRLTNALIGKDPRNVDRLFRDMMSSDVGLGLLPGRGHERHQRHRVGAVGHHRTGAGRSDLAASGRQVPRPHPHLQRLPRGRRRDPGVVREDRQGGRGRADSRPSSSTSTRCRPAATTTTGPSATTTWPTTSTW